MGIVLGMSSASGLPSAAAAGESLHKDDETSKHDDVEEASEETRLLGVEVDDEQTEIEAAAEKLRSDMMSEKMFGKLAFTIGVTNMLLSLFLFLQHFYFFIYFYSIKVPILFAVRFVLYYQSKNHYFMLDFCYFGNLLMMAFLWPNILKISTSEPWLFLVVWGVINGPVAWAVVGFGNSLVFHSIDKTTSLFLHLTPTMVSYVVRWHLQKDFNVCEPGEGACSLGYQFTYIVGGGCLYFFSHGFLYYLVVQCFCMRCNKEFAEGKDESGQQAYWTSFRYLTRRKDSLITRLVFSLGSGAAPYIWGGINVCCAAATMLLSVLMYNYQIVHTTFGVMLVLYATWAGANFYYEVFSKSKGVGVNN